METLLIVAAAVIAVWWFTQGKGKGSKRSAARSGPMPERIRDVKTGFYWEDDRCVALAAGRGFNTEVVGESSYQDALSGIVGGISTWGANNDVVAQLALEPNNPHDPNAVAVLVESQIVGHIPRGEAPAIRDELIAVTGGKRAVTCKARISGGWDRGPGERGSFCINLSLARPLKERRPSSSGAV